MLDVYKVDDADRPWIVEVRDIWMSQESSASVVKVYQFLELAVVVSD